MKMVQWKGEENYILQVTYDFEHHMWKLEMSTQLFDVRIKLYDITKLVF